LHEKGVEDAWDIAATLVEIGFKNEELDTLSQAVGPENFPLAIEWLCASATIYTLAAEIDEGAERMSEIVKALKNYTYMDQAPIQNVDIHDGLDSTLVILRSKLASGVSVERHYADDLPLIEAYGSELNQVWTNIIDNAIDAMEGEGKIILRTRYEKPWVIVEIEDNGPGIPKEIQEHIFDLFFTTKLPGKGTGLGLNISHKIIVEKHHGDLTVTSEPGKTCFEIRLPTSLDAIEMKKALIQN
jgi:signal transduction histidine kinase